MVLWRWRRRAVVVLLNLPPLGRSRKVAGMARMARREVWMVWESLEREAVRKALRDPSARVVYWVPDFDTYADVEGKAVALESVNGSLTPVNNGDSAVAVLIHDSALDDEPALLTSVASATAMLIQKAP